MSGTVLLAWAFASIGPLLFGSKALRGWARVREAQKWQMTSGTITVSGIQHGHDGGGNQVSEAKIEYEFEVDGRVVGTTPLASDQLFFGPDDMGAFVRRFPVGAKVDVFYDPSNPSRSCVDRSDVTSIKTNAILAGALAALGAVVVVLVR